MPVFAGLIAGQIFAEMDSPVSIVNTLRFGYNDNVYQRADEKESFFVHEILDLGFESSLSERTDFMMKSRIHVKSERNSDIYPNLYALLNHAVSPRLLLQLSDKFTSGERTGLVDGDEDHNYFKNNVSLQSTYVVDEKNRVNGSVSYAMARHDSEIDVYDYTAPSAGLSWTHALNPQKTRLTLGTQYTDMKYDNNSDGDYTATSLFGEVGHTFSPRWQGTVKGGATSIDRDNGERSTSPLVGLGLVYAPSPITRFTADYSMSYSESTDSSSYTGYDQQMFQFGVQHDLTAKLMAKATVKYSLDDYTNEDRILGAGSDNEEERMELALRLTYKLNRINFLEFGVKHTEKDRDVGDDWEQNIVDVGWRVEL